MTKKLIKLVNTKGKSNKKVYRELKDGLDQHDDSKQGFDADTLRKDYKSRYGIDLPITGGLSESEERAIVILDKRDSYAIQVEYAILKFFADSRGCDYEIVERICYSKNDKKIEKFRIAWSDDNLNYYNYYFDITASNERAKENTNANTEITFVPKLTPYMKDVLKRRKNS